MPGGVRLGVLKLIAMKTLQDGNARCQGPSFYMKLNKLCSPLSSRSLNATWTLPEAPILKAMCSPPLHLHRRKPWLLWHLQGRSPPLLILTAPLHLSHYFSKLRKGERKITFAFLSWRTNPLCHWTSSHWLCLHFLRIKISPNIYSLCFSLLQGLSLFSSIYSRSWNLTRHSFFYIGMYP